LIGNWLLLADEASGEGLWWTPLIWTVLVFALILILGRVALSHAREKLTRNPLTLMAEHLYLWIESMCLNVIGPHGRKYIPFVVTIYLIVLFSNLFGLVGLVAPTGFFGVTFGLAVVVVIYVQEEGIRANGPIGYVKHFFGPPLGSWALLPISFLLFFIEVISEAAKMLSLSLRLQGNIHGEHQVGTTLGSLLHFGNFSVPLQTILVPLGVFVCLVQALVFTMLTCVYLGMMTHHEEDESHSEGHLAEAH
jgi:F-type H+-transporting ATPase subunit a